jgi:16S rRNA (cytidine1402-2'-O)-methyltransferase
MLNILGNRNICINRELTKKYQEVIRDNMQNCINILNERDIKGEFVIIVEGFTGEIEVVSKYDELDEREYVIKLVEEGMNKKEAIKIVCKERKLSKNDVYQQVLDL